MVKALYFGLDSSRFVFPFQGHILAHPLIALNLLPVNSNFFQALDHCSHLIITSPAAAKILLQHAHNAAISLFGKTFLAIGAATAHHLPFPVEIAPTATSEGMVQLLQCHDLSTAHILYPHSLLARPIIRDFLVKSRLKVTEIILYETCVRVEAASLDVTPFDCYIFTSPSTVDAFVTLFGEPLLRREKKLIAIGPITQKRLEKITSSPILVYS